MWYVMLNHSILDWCKTHWNTTLKKTLGKKYFFLLAEAIFYKSGSSTSEDGDYSLLPILRVSHTWQLSGKVHSRHILNLREKLLYQWFLFIKTTNY